MFATEAQASAWARVMATGKPMPRASEAAATPAKVMRRDLPRKATPQAATDDQLQTLFFKSKHRESMCGCGLVLRLIQSERSRELHTTEDHANHSTHYDEQEQKDGESATRTHRPHMRRTYSEPPGYGSAFL